MKGTPARSLRQIGRAAMNAALAAVLAIGLVSSWSIGDKAYADTGSVWISNNGTETYDGYTTNFFTANGQVAWCSQPNLSTAAGAYSYWTTRGDASTAWTAYAVAMLYADTSSIFDKDPRVGRPLTSLDNNPVKDGVGAYLDRIRDSCNNDDSWYTRSHVLLSYAANEAMSGWCDPFKGCTNRGDWEAQCSEFWNACWTVASGGCLPGVSQAECDELRAVAQTSEIAFTNTSGTQSVTWLAKIGVGYGAIDLSKASDDASITEGNPMYDLSGARYGIYRSWDDAASRASEAASMTTDGNGYAWCGRLSQGTYYVRETAAPAGYEVDDAIYEVYVKAGSTARVNGDQVSDEVASLTGGPTLAKYDAEGAYIEGGNQPQGDASLALAEYTIKYYAANDASGTQTRTWVLRTDANGQIDLAKAKDSFEVDGQTYSYKVSGDDFYEHRGSVCLPLGTVTVQETRAPQGYLLPNPAPVRVGHIKQGHTSSIIWEDGKAVQDENTGASKQADGETVVRCGLSIDKSDFENKQYAALGGAELDGAVFEVVNNSKHDVRVGGVLYGNGEVVATLTVADGRATTDADGDGVDRTLPFGTYTVRETIAGEGYTISEDVVNVTGDDFSRDGAVIEKKRADGEGIENKVKRGDVEFTKADASTGKRLAGVAFSITSDTTGESHVAVTDGNGYFSSSSAKHSENTNANDKAVTYEDGEAVVDSSKLDANAGVWFGAWGEGKMTAADDSLGALPWDTYTVRELRCEGNSGLQLVSDIKLVVSKDKVSVTLGTIDDTVPTVSTTAFSGELGNKKIVADAEAVELCDRVAYSGVVPGFEYTVRGTVYDKSTGAPLMIDGKKVCAEKPFTAEGTSGQLEMEFTLADTSAIADGAKLVVFEDLYQGREKVASHADISDSEQTIAVARPKIGTTALDGESATHDAVRDTEMGVVDSVAYKGCIPGREYKVCGKLVDKATGEAIRDAAGVEVCAQTTFTPDAADGTVEVVFAFDGSNLAEGTQMVAFETLTRNGREMAVHADVEDAAQTVTVTVPGVATTATDEADGDKTVAADPASGVVDTVELTGLVVGREYTLRAALMSVDADGNAAPLQSGGEPVRAEKTFTATEANMTVDMPMAFDSSALAEGAKLVAFEELARGEAVIADHKDASDEGQTVTVAHPRVGTVAGDALDGDKLVSCDTEMRVVDTVSYSGVVPGREYTVEGTLMVKSTYDDGAIAAEPLLRGGEPVVASATFTPEGTEGTATVEFAFDGSDLPEGTELVAFEKLLRAGAEVASHEDAADTGQTVTVIKPILRTTALDSVDGDKVVASDPEACVVDKVAFANAAPGKAYRVVGELVELDADGQPGQVVARGETAFTAEKASGEVEVRFDVDATALVGKKLVVFEHLYRGETMICEHADADDADQTIDEVRKPEIATIAADVVDGDKAAVADRSLKIGDEVRLSGVVPGREYTLRASVIVLSPVIGEDGQTQGWEKVGEVDGAPMGETTFTADAADCTQKVELPEMSEVPLSDEAAWLEVLKGASGKHSWRAWERLCFDGKLAAERSRIAHERTGESMNDWDARTWCDENGIDPVASDWQASLVAQGASFLAGRRLGGRINLADAAARAVSCAVSGGTGYHTERDFANDPSLGELAYLVATGAEGYRCPLLTTWLEETTAEAEKEYREATARKSDSSYHYVRSIGERIELKMGERAWDDAVEEVGRLIEPWRAERAAHIAAFKDSDAPAAVAYRSRAEHLNENVEALQEVAPDDLRPSDISASLGSTWIPADDVKDFMIEEIGLTWVSSEDKIIVSYSPVTAKWSVKAPGVSWKPEGLEKWGTDRVDPIEMIKSSLNCARVTVRDAQVEIDPISGEEKIKKVVNPAETLAAQQKQSALEDRFAAWVWEDEKRASRLAKEYNERFNSIVPRAFDGAELRFPDMNSGIALRPWQRDAVARILQGRTGTLLAHTVGAGKTMEFCAGAMESKRLGLCNKPMIVVPNHLVDQTAAEFLTLYPAARLLVARKEDFKKENRRALMARTATGDWDSIIVGQSQFEMLPLSPAAQKTYVQQRIDEFQEACRIAKEQAGKRDPTVKEMERQLARFQARMEALIKEERKDDAGGITFDATGVDMLVVDEAHAYKNLALQTKMSRVAGVASHGSQRSEDMLMKTRWLHERYGGRNIVFATGTPVSNSMVELYNMQTYLDPETLRSMGINCFDEWATTFGKREVSFEITPEGGGYQQKERFSRFVNMPELMSAARTFSDIKMAADIDLKLPECEVHAVAVQPTEEQKAAVEDLIARAERLREGHVDPTVDNMLKVTGDGRKVALDVRLLDPESATDDIEPGGKIEACAENVRRIWKDTADQRGAQLVFCDTSTPASGKWNIYEDLKRRLVDLGIPSAQIAFVHDAGDKPERKEALFARVREGDVRVLIGSTEKMGTGTNVQDRLAATHDLDCPWRPADLEQRQGRIMRQGNRFEHVDVFRYVCVGTFDSYLYQLVEGKQRFVSQVFSSDAGAREVGDLDDAVTLSYSQMKAAAAGDDRIRERMELENKVTRLTMLKQTHEGQARRASRRAEETLPKRIADAQETLAAAKADAARTLSGWEASGMAISGRSYADKKEAGAALRAAADRVPAGLSQEIGSYRGLSVMARMEAATGLPTLGLSGERTFWVSRSAYVQPIRNVDSLDKIADMVLEAPARLEAEIAEAKAELEAARTAAEAPFPQAEELASALARISVLDEELGIAPGDAPEDDDAPSEGGSAIAGGQRLPASEQDNELPAELSASLESVTVKETTEPAAKDSVMPITKMAGQYDPDDPPTVQLACLMDDLTKFTYHRINGRPAPDMPAGGPRETSELIAKLAAELGPAGDKWMARVEELRNVVRKRNEKNAAGADGGAKAKGQQPHAQAKSRFKRK